MEDLDEQLLAALGDERDHITRAVRRQLEEHWEGPLAIQRREAEDERGGSSYMTGLYNGMLMILSTLDGGDYNPMETPNNRPENEGIPCNGPPLAAAEMGRDPFRGYFNPDTKTWTL